MDTSVSFRWGLWQGLVFCLLLFATIGQSFAADPTFSVTTTSSNSGISYLITADFNRDNLADLATLDTSGISVLLGKGDGTFGAPVVSPAGTHPDAAVVADVNGDGVPDLAVGSDQVTILLGNGDGSFRMGASFVGNSPGFAEFNSDGKVDLAFVQSGAVWIAPGNGDGTFGNPAQVSPAGLYTNVGPLATGDYNGDGIGDIAFADCCDPNSEAAPIGHVYVLYGNGAGAVASTYSEQAAQVAYLRTVDFNKDSIDDLAESWSGCHTPCMGLTVHLGNADRQLHSVLPDITEPTFDTFIPGPGVTADFNADGRNDIAFDDPNFFPESVSSTVTNAVFVSLQKEDGTPTDPPLEFDLGAGISEQKMIVTADFNGDGTPDLATRSGDATVAILLNTTAGRGGTGGGTQTADFSLSAFPQEGTVTAGGSTTATITVTGSNGFNDAVALTCAGLPAGATCTFTPGTVSPGQSSTTSTLVIATTGATAKFNRSMPWYALWLPIAGLAFAGAGRTDRKKFIVLLAIVGITFLMMQGCGGSSGSNVGGNTGGSAGNGGTGGNTGGTGGNNGGTSGGSTTQAGVYQVAVTGTSGTITRTTAFTLTVQ